MAEQEMAGEDASLDAATARIMGLGMSNLIQDESKLDRLDNTRGDIDLNEATGETDLDELEKAQEARTETEADEAEKGGDDADAGEETATFIELPSTEEGKEGERVPLSEAVEAVLKLRQIDGDINAVVIKAEEEAIAKHDKLTTELSTLLETARTRDEALLRALVSYGPQPPHPALKDPGSEYYNPSEWVRQNDVYRAFMEDFSRLQGEVEKTGKAKANLDGHVTETEQRRAHDRIARYIPEWKDEKTREGFKAEVVDVLGKRYGVTKADVDDIIDHTAWRMMADLVKQVKAETKAPEVRKAVQERAPKLVNGRPPAMRDNQTGRFVTEARGRLKQSGSEDDFVNFLLAGKRTPARR